MGSGFQQHGLGISYSFLFFTGYCVPSIVLRTLTSNSVLCVLSFHFLGIYHPSVCVHHPQKVLYSEDSLFWLFSKSVSYFIHMCSDSFIHNRALLLVNCFLVLVVALFCFFVLRGLISLSRSPSPQPSLPFPCSWFCELLLTFLGHSSIP